MLSKNRPTFGDRFTVRQTLDWVFDEWKQTVAEGNPNHYNKVWAAIETCANSVADIRGYGESDPSVTPDQPAAPDTARNEAESLKASATLKDSCIAPDEDAAVLELAKIMCGEEEICEEHWDCAEVAISAGYTRRPVDTRPTRSQLYDNVEWPSWVDSPHDLASALIEVGYAVEDPVPDPAPAAEVPVFASVEEAEAWLDEALSKQWGAKRIEGEWAVWEFGTSSIYGTDYLTVLQELAALTKATDR